MNDYKDLIERLKHGVGIINLERAGILDWSTLQEAADAIKALIAERDAVRILNVALIKNKTTAPEELAALKQKIASAEPAAWLCKHKVFGTLEIDVKDAPMVGGWSAAFPVYLYPPADEKMREDAERYRWLRGKGTGPCQIWETVCEQDGSPLYCTLKHSESLDSAIDAARAAEGEK